MSRDRIVNRRREGFPGVFRRVFVRFVLDQSPQTVTARGTENLSDLERPTTERELGGGDSSRRGKS